MTDLRPVRDLLRLRSLDAELAALLWLLLEARTPLVLVSRAAAARDGLLEGLSCLLPPAARIHPVRPDDDFGWLPEAAALGWREEGDRPPAACAGQPATPAGPGDGVLLVRGLASPHGVAGERARLVVRALALGYGLLATMEGEGLGDALDALREPAVGADEDERTRLGLVLAVAEAADGGLVTAAHYVRPVARDAHGHVQRLPPAVLAARDPRGGGLDHFAWGVLGELASRTGHGPAEFEREQARRAALLARPGEPGEHGASQADTGRHAAGQRPPGGEAVGADGG